MEQPTHYHARSTAATRYGQWSKTWLPLQNWPRRGGAAFRQPTRVTRFNCSGQVPVHWDARNIVIG